MSVYYNEIDPYCAKWLANLMDDGLIPRGDIDTRSIEDVIPNELRGYTQCHFFAGLGGWPYALQLAGWGTRPVWTGSCPCQPFSIAGKGGGTSDSRHLWPHFYRLIKACRPSVVFGEQVASADVLGRSTRKKDYLSYLQYREELRGVPNSWSAPEVQRHLQELSERAGTKKTFAEVLLDCGSAQAMETKQSRQRASVVSTVSGASSWSGIRSRCESYSGEDQCRILRAYGNAVQSQGQTQFTFAGQERSEQGLHDGQYPRGVDMCESHAEYMGSREDFTDRGCAQEQAINDQRGSTGTNDASVDAHSGTVWIDAVFNDLETTDYACASIAFPAAGIGAPHVRERNYWVADTGGPRGQGLVTGQDPCVIGPWGWRGKEDLCAIAAAPFSAGDRWPEPLVRRLDDGLSGRLDELRAYGNAIVPQAAAAFITAYMQARGLIADQQEVA